MPTPKPPLDFETHSTVPLDHAKLAPSTAERWNNCPGARELCQCGKPRRPDCDGDGWLYAGTPYDGSVAIGACPND